MTVCVPLRNFMGAPAPGAPMLPTPVIYRAENEQYSQETKASHGDFPMPIFLPFAIFIITTCTAFCYAHSILPGIGVRYMCACASLYSICHAYLHEMSFPVNFTSRTTH